MQSSLQVRPLSGLQAGCRSALRYPLKQPAASYPRRYATQNSLGPSTSAPRKQVTVTSDDGRVRWGELSRKEKTARATQQSANFAVIVVGAVMTVSSRGASMLIAGVFANDLFLGWRVHAIIQERVFPAEQNQPFQPYSRADQGRHAMRPVTRR